MQDTKLPILYNKQTYYKPDPAAGKPMACALRANAYKTYKKAIKSMMAMSYE